MNVADTTWEEAKRRCGHGVRLKCQNTELAEIRGKCTGQHKNTRSTTEGSTQSSTPGSITLAQQAAELHSTDTRQHKTI